MTGLGLLLAVGVSLNHSFEIPSGDETAWGNPPVTRELITGIRKLGFTSLRLPMTECARTRVEEVAGWARAEGLEVEIGPAVEPFVVPRAFTVEHEQVEFDSARDAAQIMTALRGKRSVTVVAERQFRNEDRRLPNDDARVRWAYAVGTAARELGVEVYLMDTGVDPKAGVLDRKSGTARHPSLVKAFVGGATGTLSPEAAEALARAAYVGEKTYPKTDRVLVWKLDGKSYRTCWGQRIGAGSASGNGAVLENFRTDDAGNLLATSNGRSIDMLHQQFWADQSATAIETLKAYAYTHGETPLKGRRLVFTLTALKGTTAVVAGLVTLPGVAKPVPFGAGPDHAGAFRASPEQPTVRVEIPLTEGVLGSVKPAGISVELKLYPGPWQCAQPLDCKVSPIELK